MDTTIRKQGRIKSLEGLRAIAFLGVVFCHTGLASGKFNLVGHWAVSLFFVLSGFVSVYSQFNKNNFNPSFSYNFKYFINRIKKLYPLFVLTCFALIIFNFIGNDTEPLSDTLIQLGLNVTLLQEWLPLKLRSINSPAWFLCTLALFYFIFPWILKSIQNNCTKKKAKIMIGIFVIIEILISILSLFIPRPVYSKNMILEYDIVYWLAYRFPLSRVLDCLIGCYLGYIYYVNEEEKITFVNAKEIVALILCLISSVVASVVRPVTPTGVEVPYVSYTIGWSYALLFLPSTISVIYLFAFEQGKISKLFGNKIFIYLAKIGVYGFLIHSVIFNYLSKIIYYILGKDAASIFVNQYGGWINLTIGFALTLIATQVWIWFMGLFSKPKKKVIDTEPSK